MRDLPVILTKNSQNHSKDLNDQEILHADWSSGFETNTV